MLQLFLDEPAWDGDEFYMQRISLLENLESILWSVIVASGLSEARLWLCDALSRIKSISGHSQRDLFLTLLKSKPIRLHLASQVVQLIFERLPQKLGPVIAKKSHRLVNYFEGNPRRILHWFSNFASSGDLGHVKGAKALSQFAFVNRDICWEELEWKGKHGQSPAMVATKPHYFLDLDVQRTVENFLEYVPEFWSSREFSESLKDGDIFLTDADYFIDLFLDLMYEEKFPEVWEVIEEFLMEQPFSLLCHHLLISLDGQGLRFFLDSVPKYSEPKSKSAPITEWLEIVLSKYGCSVTIDQLLLLNALTNHGRQLVRFVKEEGSGEEKGKIIELAYQLSEVSGSVKFCMPIVKEGDTMKAFESVNKCGLLSWAIHFRLSEEFVTPGAWESLFNCNGIEFVRQYTSPRGGDFELEDGGRSCRSIKHKKFGKHGKKRKLNCSPVESHDDFASVRGSQANVEDWLLSTDGYSAAWNIKDLPEHISSHCFTTWLNSLFPMLGIVA